MSNATGIRSQGVHHHRYDLAGTGRLTAFELAKHGAVVLVGRDRRKLAEVQKGHRTKGPARCFGCVRLVGYCERAACGRRDHRAPTADRGPAQQRGYEADTSDEERAGLGHDLRNEPSWALRADGGTRAASSRWYERSLYFASAVENPERQPAKTVGFRGARYISAEASARGEWKPGGSKAARRRRLCNVQAVHPRGGTGLCP